MVMGQFKSYHVPNLEGKVWKPVYGMEDYYEVSNKGRVKSLLREIETKNGGYRMQQEMLLVVQIRPHKNTKHQSCVTRFTLDGVRYSRTLASVVCEAFHGPRPSPELMALHLNGDSLNNTPENVYWGNWDDSAELGLDNGRFDHLTKREIQDIKQSSFDATYLAEYYEVSYNTIKRIQSGESWKAIK